MTDIVEQTKQVAAQLSAERFQGWVNPLVINVMEAAAEIERLRLSLSEARATGRREGLSEAAEIAEQRITYRFDDGSTAITRLLPSGEAIAAAIRAAMEK